MSPSSGSPTISKKWSQQNAIRPPRFYANILPFLGLFLAGILLYQSSLNDAAQVTTTRAKLTSTTTEEHVDGRLRRQTNSRSESLLTVEWEGIQSGDHPDSSIRGFIVEYRAEKEQQWNVHSGIIPYKGPNHQYRVQIPRLPTGISYFVRIKVLGDKNEVLVETPEIRARNEIVSIKCETDEVTVPRDIEVKERGQFSVALTWQSPECGSVGEYQIELRGRRDKQFDVHRQTVAQPSASVTGLLPGTEYAVRIRAVDRSRTVGPWNEELVTVSTKGEHLEVLSDVSIVYTSATAARIRWAPLDDERIQHYEVILVELDKNSDLPERIERVRLQPTLNSHLFSGLKPNTEYKVGVIPYVDHEPRRIYSLSVPTTTNEHYVVATFEKPVVVADSADKVYVHWKLHDSDVLGAEKFVVEYRPIGDDSKWLKAGDDVLVRKKDLLDSSYFTTSPDLANAAFVRVIVVDAEGAALAQTAEAMVVQNEGISCHSLAVSPAYAEPSSSLTSIKFSWKRPLCDESTSPITGFEYSIWKKEEEASAEVLFTDQQNSIEIGSLEPHNTYLFRIRSRLAANEHGPWSDVVEATTSDDVSKDPSSENVNVKSASKDIEASSPVFGIPSLQLVATEDLGPKIIVHWKATGDESKVRAYQVEQRPRDETHWHPVSNYVPVTAHQQEYQAEVLRGMLITVQEILIRVRAIGSDGNVLAVSGEMTLSRPCKKIEQAPSDVSLIRESANSAILKWTFPTENVEECGLYFVISGTINRAAVQLTVDGNAREYQFDQAPSDAWKLSVNAVNKMDAGPASDAVGFQQRHTQQPIGRAESNEHHHDRRKRRSICDPRTDFWCRDDDFDVDNLDAQIKGEALISVPTISQTPEGTIRVQWRSVGSGRGVYGYKVLFRAPNTGWNPYGQIVPYVGDDEEYNLVLSGLLIGQSYQVQVQALDRNSYVLYTSPEVTAKSSCQSPSQPPTHIAIDSPDSRHVRVTWKPPPQSSWFCSQVEIEIQVDEPFGISPVTVDNRQTSHVFDSTPDQRWTVRARTVNSAGKSAWTTSVSARSPPAGELIEGPFVSNIQGVSRLSWRNREGSDPDLIDHFKVEWRTPTEQRWSSLSDKVPYTGWQRPYAVDLTSLPHGHVIEVRVKAVDHNFEDAFVSPSVTIQSSPKCSPPRSPPKNIEVSAIGPTQIRLSWQPLSENDWNCDSVWYVVKYSNPESQGYKNLTQGETQTVFESKPSTQWQFEVQAANPAGSSHWSMAKRSSTFDTAPGPVSDISSQSLSSDSVQLSWRPPVNPNGVITGYEITYQLISRGMCDNTPERPNTVFSDKTGYTLAPLYPHSRYRVAVAAQTIGAGERVVREIQTDQAVPSAAPANFRVENVDESFAELSWHAPPCMHTNGDITEYEYEVTGAGRPVSSIPRTIDVTRTTRIQLSGLVGGTKYSARVRAYTSRGAGPWSQPVQFQTRGSPVVIAQPQLQQQIVSDPNPRIFQTGPSEAHLVWQTGQQNAAYYDMFRCQWAPSGTQSYQQKVFPAYSPCEMATIRRHKLPESTETLQTHCGPIQNLRSDTTYRFQVSSKPRDGSWAPWSPPQPPTPAPSFEAPVRITSLTKTGGSSSSLRFSWTVPPTDMLRCTAFRITVVPRDGREPARVFTVDGRTFQYQVDGLRAATIYAVTVEPIVNEQRYPGLTVDMSTDANLFFGLTHAPRIVEERATSITIAWDVPQRIECSGFLIEYRLEDGVWQQFDRRVPCHANRRTYTGTVTELPTNSVVDFRVRVISLQNQQSPPSPEVRGHTKCSPPESPPQALRVDSPSINEVRVSWARPAKSTWNCDELNVDIGYRVGSQPERVITVTGDKTTHVFPSEPNTRWIVRVRSSNPVGTSPWSPEQTLATRQGAPGAIRGLRLTPLSPNEIRVQWMPPQVSAGTIVGYDISYRLKHRLACPDEEPRDVSREFMTIYNFKDLDYTLTGLLPNSLYEVKVRARTTELGPEESGEAATFQQPPSAPPLNLQLTYALERSLSFQWEPVECSQRHGDIINYEYEIIGQDDWAKLERQIANTTNTRVTIEGLTPFTKYVFRVKAYNGVGGGPNTENLDVMTSKANAPLPPQDLVVTQEGTTYIIVSWLPPYPPYGPHDKYKLQYQLMQAPNWESIEIDVKDNRLACPVPGPRLCFNITGLQSGQQYRIRVAAHIEGGSYGPYSNTIIANTLMETSYMLRIKLLGKTDHSLHVGWEPPLDVHGHITHYCVEYRSIDEPNSQKETVFVKRPQESYLIDNLNADTTYNVSISAGTSRGCGAATWGTFKTDQFQTPRVLNAPVVTPEGPYTLDVEWKAALDSKNRINGYILEYRKGDTSIWTEYGGVTRHEPSKLTYSMKIRNLEPDTLYFVRIKVVDNKNKVSEPSPEGQGRTGCAPPMAPPTNVRLDSTHQRQVKISWQAPSKSSWLCAAIRYRVECINGANPRQVVDVPSALTEHTFDSEPGTDWICRVQTVNEAGQSPWSDYVKLKTLDVVPGAVKDLGAKPTGPDTAEAWWTPPDSSSPITGYTLTYVLRSVGECGPSSAVKPITKHTTDERIELDGLIPDSTYDVYVVAHTTKEGPKSKVVSFRTEEALPSGAPKNLRVSGITSTRAEVVWNEIECELRHGKIVDYKYELEVLSEWGGRNSTQWTSSQRVSLDNLTPFTNYRVRVQGRNSKGSGPFTEWVPFQTLPAAPPPPTDLRDELQLDHAIEISFLPPYPPNGIIDFYRVRHTPHKKFNYKETQVPAFQLECSDSSLRQQGRKCHRVTGLEPEESYEIQAAAHTERGDWSDWSEPLITSTTAQQIPVPEQPLQLDFVKSTSIGVKWQGLDEDRAEHIVGYVLEFKSEDDIDWQEWNGVVKHRARQPEYKAAVKNLIESTEYFFRLRVVGKGDKRGGPGPELKAITKCGPPDQPPQNVKLESIDYQNVRVTWENPSEESWRCDQVEFVLHYSNASGHYKTLQISSDAPQEISFDSVPGTRWNVKMRTQTIEPGEEPQFSKWSPTATLITKSQPDSIFVLVTPKTPTSAELTWRLPEGYEDWPYGVDVSYRLLRMGSCKKLSPKDQEPVVLENVQEKQVLLDDLHPGSEYEVTVTLRRPPGLGHLPVKKTVKKFQTEDLVPTGAPHSLKVELRQDTKLGFSWEPPECIEQNGEISQYEYELTGLENWNKGVREGVSPRTRAEIGDLMPGSLYRFRVRAFTSAGPGPWSEPIDARTTGSEIGPPRDLTSIGAKSHSIAITWLPPHPEISPIAAYRVRYSTRADESHPTEEVLSGDELTCAGFNNPIITGQHQCSMLTGLKPSTTYKIAVQAQSVSGNWGPLSPYIFPSTGPEIIPGGYLQLVFAKHDNMKVRWGPPISIVEDLDRFEVFITSLAPGDPLHQRHDTPSAQKEFHFKGLTPLTRYNVTVHGFSHDARMWVISNIFSTTEILQGLNWIPALCDLDLVEKTESSLHLSWSPPDVFDSNHRDSLTHYRVTIAPLESYSLRQGPMKNYTVPFPGTSIRFDDLSPQTMYNVTLKAGTDDGYGPLVWAVWSTLPLGAATFLKLVTWSPASITVQWEPIWGVNKGYVITAKPLSSIYSHVKTSSLKSYEVDSSETEFTLSELEPSTTYNVSLIPKDSNDGVWGVFSTMNAGCFLPGDLKHCDQTRYATAMSWEPIEFNLATHYQVRYIHLKSPGANWVFEEERHRKYLLCPKDPCNRLCYLVFNLEHHPEEYAFQVRAMVNGQWNNWALAGRPTIQDPPEVKESCCIVPPPYHVHHIGEPGTYWEIPIAPSPTEQNISRYYVVVDERDPPGDTNWTMLTDKVSSNRRRIPYYVTGSFSTETLTEPTTVRIGDGTVVGGYLNYPLTKGKTYNYELYTKWMMANGQPVIARLRVGDYLTAGWPWWWLLLLLLLLLLCILLCCLLLWLCQERRRRRRYAANGIEQERLISKDRTDYYKSRGDFEEGYAQGHRDAQKGISRHLEEDFMSNSDHFREGYANGFRDGRGRMTASMSNLAQRSSNRQGYSAGYMQGFRDGNSGVFGDRITESLLRRLEEQYPNNDDFKAGYIDGFKDGIHGGRSFAETRRIQQSLTELTERLEMIEKSKGDEIHSTKIYHVYNQSPEGGYVTSSGQHYVDELEEIASGSRTKSALRKHYTPGDYLKYEGPEFDEYNSLRRAARRSMSASALAREASSLAVSGGFTSDHRHRRLSGAASEAQAGLVDSESYARSARYNRSRSELGSPQAHRYASQTLLDAPRPGPAAHTTRRSDALNALQRELDSLSRPPRTAAATAAADSSAIAFGGGGYSSDTGGFMEQQSAAASRSATASRATTARGFDYGHDTTFGGRLSASEAEREEKIVAEAAAVDHELKASATGPASYRQQGDSGTGGQWPEDLINIVHEPMGHTLDRMRQYSSSMSNVDRGQEGAAADQQHMEQKYHRTYREEHSSGR